MAVKTILTEPNKILRQISKPVEKVGKEEQKLMDDMLDTMYAANGIGLAAIQIGVPKRIIVMDISKDQDKKDQNENKEKQNKDEDKEDKGNPQPQGADKQKIENILEAVNNAEKKIQEKVNARKQKGVRIQTDKDW